MNATCRTCSATYGGRAEHCTACHETFTGTTAGEMHRRGDHGIKTGPDRRRCLTADEMLDKGMARNVRGHWKSTDDPWTGPTGDEPIDASGYCATGPCTSGRNHPGPCTE